MYFAHSSLSSSTATAWEGTSATKGGHDDTRLCNNSGLAEGQIMQYPSKKDLNTFNFSMRGGRRKIVQSFCRKK